MLRWGLAALGVALIAGLCAGCANPSVAKYPYCLNTMDSERDCRYASLEQCEISRAGTGGSCDASPYYKGSTPRGAGN